MDISLAQVGFVAVFVVLVYFGYKAVKKSQSKPNVRK